MSDDLVKTLKSHLCASLEFIFLHCAEICYHICDILIFKIAIVVLLGAGREGWGLDMYLTLTFPIHDYNWTLTARVI